MSELMLMWSVFYRYFVFTKRISVSSVKLTQPAYKLYDSEA